MSDVASDWSIWSPVLHDGEQLDVRQMEVVPVTEPNNMMFYVDISCKTLMATCIRPSCTPRLCPCCCKDGPVDGGCRQVNDQRAELLPPTLEERQTPSLCRAVSPIGNSENFPGNKTCID